ncbi:homogentisate 1,2-dioxygenase [Caulobacter flavus]|uniref:Homogentisate 1,2-dioxygenase n=1 Tax=Caulobacter flavus TaxID=1679497 RepID=A0A2N5CVN9_9CAUL|nr:homogentisate 1,2-dioxygenase [Caulobacter flavus]AYV46964.1 homogentisate 1,2-dioxygenase [Caulobacter flavus]PLR17874.1 homogentisate 1,2-dioxygenase [Caulobacter flavus]
MRLALILATGLSLAAPAAFARSMPASQPDVACAPGVEAGLPPELAAWVKKAPLTAATSAAGLPDAMLTPGQAYAAALSPTPEIAYAVQPEKPGGTVSKGGLFSLKVEAAGSYVIALGTGAWIDVLKDGATQRSTAHGRGAACSTVRKMVTFDLAPGDYVIQISANAQAELPIMVARKP